MVAHTESDTSSHYSDDNASSIDWEDTELQIACPFCDQTRPSTADLFSHCSSDHELIREAGLDVYDCIRLVNYTRQMGVNGSLNMDSLIAEGRSADWLQNETYLKPYLPYDPLLNAFEFDDDEEDEEEHSRYMPDSSNADSLSMAQLSLEDRSALEQRAMRAEKEAETLREAFSQYKDMVRQTFYEDKAATLPPTAESPTPSSSSTIVDGSAPTWDMDYYFESYSELEIHESMLKDAARTEAYRDALYHNKDFFKGKVVLDVGCGTGILSMFAARAGASQVYSVDNATIINKARQIVTANGLDDIITFVPGQVEQVTLPVDKVDVIISEWMGYFLLFEGMFDSVIAARDRWLAPDGIMAPSRMTMLVGAFQDSEYVNDRYHFWKNVYGFDMSAMKGFLLRDAQVDYAHAESLVSVPQVVKEIDTKTSTVPQLDFLTELSLEIMSEEALLHGLIGWFDTYFEGPDAFETILLSTGPAATPTHWKQCLFLFETPLEVTKGSLIKGTFECVKSLECHRELIVKVNVYVEGNEKTRIQQTYRVR